MKWLTIKQIEKAARGSDLDACECSLKHWMQVKTAGAKELRKAFNRGRVGCEGSFCALCLHQHSCCNCSLEPKDRPGCCDEYQYAKRAIENWYKNNGGTYKEVQKAITPLTNRLRKAVIDARERA